MKLNTKFDYSGNAEAMKVVEPVDGQLSFVKVLSSGNDVLPEGFSTGMLKSGLSYLTSDKGVSLEIPKEGLYLVQNDKGSFDILSDTLFKDKYDIVPGESGKCIAIDSDYKVKSGLVPDIVVSLDRNDFAVAKQNIEHPGVDFVLSFFDDKNYNKALKKPFGWKRHDYVREVSGDSLIELDYRGIDTDKKDPIYHSLVGVEGATDNMVDRVLKSLPDEFIKGESFGIAMFGYEYPHKLDECKFACEDLYDAGALFLEKMSDRGLNINQIVVPHRFSPFIEGVVSQAIGKKIPVVVHGTKELLGRDLSNYNRYGNKESSWFGVLKEDFRQVKGNANPFIKQEQIHKVSQDTKKKKGIRL